MSMIGKTLAHYQIISQLGKGGMGEVYRAKVEKLGRDCLDGKMGPTLAPLRRMNLEPRARC